MESERRTRVSGGRESGDGRMSVSCRDPDTVIAAEMIEEMESSRRRKNIEDLRDSFEKDKE